MQIWIQIQRVLSVETEFSGFGFREREGEGGKEGGREREREREGALEFENFTF